MREITDLLMEYREAKRHLWNAYFVGRVHSLRERGAIDHFEAIDRHLFSGIVLEDLGRGTHELQAFTTEPLSFLRVVPNGNDIELLVNQPRARGGSVWAANKEVAQVITEADLAFIEFFEWDRFSYASYPYYRARFTSFPKLPQLVGSECLIQTCDAKVYLADGKAETAAK